MGKYPGNSIVGWGGAAGSATLETNKPVGGGIKLDCIGVKTHFNKRDRALKIHTFMHTQNPPEAQGQNTSVGCERGKIT